MSDIKIVVDYSCKIKTKNIVINFSDSHLYIDMYGNNSQMFTYDNPNLSEVKCFHTKSSISGKRVVNKGGFFYGQKKKIFIFKYTYL